LALPALATCLGLLFCLPLPAIAAPMLPGVALVAAPMPDFGWLTFLATPLYLALRFLYGHGIGNWGWSIIVLTAIFNLVTIWPRMMAVKSSLSMIRIQPKVEALKQRYAALEKADPKHAEMSAEMLALYQAEGANLYGGCLPLLLQMPLLIAYFRVLHNATELHGAHWLWLTDLASPDPVHLLTVVIIGAMFLTQWITPMPNLRPWQRRSMTLLMPGICGVSLWGYASGLGLYWATGALMNLLIQFAINRSPMGREMLALAAARAGKGKRPGKAAPKMSAEGGFLGKNGPF
jgi:YidC/Oxa1 family membrane protein insertase